MSLRAEIEALREDLSRLAGASDPELVRRYALRPLPGERPSRYRRFRKALGRILRRAGLRPTSPIEPWLPGLKHVESSDGAKVVVIWSLRTDRDTLRAACRGFQSLQAASPGWIPVLVTDVPDFAFFSRLGWLVEYIPALSAPADGYAVRKQRYLAWRYRDAPVLPVSVGLRKDVNVEELRIG